MYPCLNRIDIVSDNFWLLLNQSLNRSNALLCLQGALTHLDYTTFYIISKAKTEDNCDKTFSLKYDSPCGCPRANIVFPKCIANMLNITLAKYVHLCTEL